MVRIQFFLIIIEAYIHINTSPAVHASQDLRFNSIYHIKNKTIDDNFLKSYTVIYVLELYLLRAYITNLFIILYL